MTSSGQWAGSVHKASLWAEVVITFGFSTDPATSDITFSRWGGFKMEVGGHPKLDLTKQETVLHWIKPTVIMGSCLYFGIYLK